MHSISPQENWYSSPFISLSYSSLQTILVLLYGNSPISKYLSSSFYTLLKLCVLNEIFLLVWKGGDCFHILQFATLWTHHSSNYIDIYIFVSWIISWILLNLLDQSLMIFYGMSTRELHPVIVLIIFWGSYPKIASGLFAFLNWMFLIECVHIQLYVCLLHAQKHGLSIVLIREKTHALSCQHSQKNSLTAKGWCLKLGLEQRKFCSFWSRASSNLSLLSGRRSTLSCWAHFLLQVA